MKTDSHTDDKFKSDVFSLGMTLLETITLNGFYLFMNNKFLDCF
jgi:hypothetical protein